MRSRSFQHALVAFLVAILAFSVPGAAIRATNASQASNRDSTQALAAPAGGPIYLDPSYTFAERAADLVARLTPAQRASQLVSSQASEISNLANPLLLPTQAVFQRNQNTLATPANAGDTMIKVGATTGMVAGRTVRVDSGGTPETVTISSVGSAAGTAGTLVLPASAGDTTINVSTISGAAAGHEYRVDVPPNLEFGEVATVGTAAGTAGTLPIGASAGDTVLNVSTTNGATVGQKYRVDAPPNLEVGTVAAVGTAAGTAGTLPIGASVGDTTIYVSTISGATVGQKYRVDAPPNMEVGTVAAVGTAAGTAGTLPIGASIGDTTIYVSTISGAAVGHKYRVDAPPNLEVGTIASVGTAAGTARTLASPAAAGDTNIKVSSVSGMIAGHKIRVDTDATIEIGTIATVGTAAATATTLAAASSVGDTNIKVASVTGMTAGNQIRVDTGANIEIGTIVTVGTTGAGGTGVDLAAPLTLAHASGAAAQDLGTGVTLTAPLAQPHAIGAGAQDLGTGITLTAPLTIAHAIGAAIQDLGTGITLAAPLASAHAVGAAIQALGTGITLAAPLASAHAVGAAIQAAGTGITLAAPLTSAHAFGAAVQDTGTGITFTPALTSAHPFGGFVDLMTGIPAYGWWNEALHGINAQTYGSGNATTLSNTTSYPIDLSRGASWDPALTYEVAKAESDEARELVPGNKLNLDFYSPTVNIGRDPRWGRNDESYGEDPLLETKIASQFVNGMEGKDQSGQLLPEGAGFYKATTTLKHYALNNTEGSGSGDPNGRLNVDTHADERTIREYYTMAFRKIIQATQNAAIMSSYNSVNGDPAAASVHLIDTLGRQTFGFQGYYTGDCDAVNMVNSRHHWQPATIGHIATPFEQFAFTLGAGEDAECNAGYSGTGNYRGATSASTTTGGTMNAIGMQIPTETGLHTVNDLDVSAMRLFTNRMKLGEFDPDSSVPWLTEAVARNKGYGVYPFVQTSFATAPTETADRLALARRSAQAGIVLLKNETITKKDSTVGKLLPIAVPPTGAFKVLVLGALANTVTLGGYSSGQSGNGAANNVSAYAGIKSAIQAINPAAQVDLLRGFTGTSTAASSCCTTIDPAAVTAAADYDYVIVYTGIDSGVAAEDRDRTAITLTGQQGQLIAQVAAVNPNTIGVMQGDPFDVTPFEPVTPSLIWNSYNGQRQGEALADVLLGAYNPSGRLPETFYQSVDQLPPTWDYTIRPVGATGRTYMYFNGPVSYPFGYGLSYTTFTFSNLVIDKHAPTADDTINVKVDVTNSGSMDGNEIVQLYVNTPDAAPALERPIKRLEGFQKVFLAAGQTKTVTLPLKIAELAFYDETAGRWAVDQGTYGIQVSTSSADADIQVHDTITVTGTLTPKPSVLTAKPRIDKSDLARGISQRVLFPEGVEIDPGLTVAMNDDTLHGFILPGQSQPFPKGMKFSYSSNRPAVVSVKGGKIRTVANGAATITATATYNGQSATTEFVVRVLSDLGDLKVNGDTISGFNPDVFDYDVILPPGATELPQVSATAPTGTVDIAQAASVPGTATITSTGPDGIVATYTVNFALAAQGDAFDGDTLGSQWSFVRETPEDWSLTTNPGAFTITPKTGDLLTTTNTARNLLLQPALGDWTMSTKVTFSARPNAATQQGGIIAYQDDDNYLKFDLEATSSSNIQFNTSLEDSLNSNPVVATPTNPTGTVQVAQTLNTTNANAILPEDNTIWLQMAKSGSTYSTSYSLDGETWVPVWSTGATLKNIKVGVFAFNRAGTTTSLQVAFDDFGLTVGAEQQIASLHGYVGVLDLDKGLTNNLQKKLEEAQKKLDQGKDEDACKKLDEFLVAVLDQAGKKDPKLTVAQAQVLLYANDILINLGCLDPASPVPAAENDLLLLGQTIDGMGLDKPVADDLGNRVREASKHLAQGKLGETCLNLSGLTAKIVEFESKAKLTADQAAQLSADVAAISGSLGC